MSEGNHSHPSLKNTSSEMEGEYPILSYETQMPDGSWVKNRVKTTLLPPGGIGFETLGGPMRDPLLSSFTRRKEARRRSLLSEIGPQKEYLTKPSARPSLDSLTPFSMKIKQTFRK